MPWEDMTIDGLIGELQDARETLGGGAKVRAAYQPLYPLRGTIRQVTAPRPAEDDDSGDRAMLWLALGPAPETENPYGPEWAWGDEHERTGA